MTTTTTTTAKNTPYTAIPVEDEDTKKPETMEVQAYPEKRSTINLWKIVGLVILGLLALWGVLGLFGVDLDDIFPFLDSSDDSSDSSSSSSDSNSNSGDVTPPAYSADGFF